MTKLETDRLRLREMDNSDAKFILEVLNEPAFIRHVGDRGIRSVADAAGYLRERVLPSYTSLGFGMWLVELKATGEPVGICGLIKRATLEDVDLGFSFLEKFWRQGFASEATTAVLDYAWQVAKLPRLVAIVSPANDASIRLLEKLGFSFEKNVCLGPGEPELRLFVTVGKLSQPVT